MEFTLKDDVSDIPSEAGKGKLKDGLKFAANDRMDRACELWSEAKAAAPNSLTLLYNLGICSETQGSPEEALVIYRQVDKMLSKPDDLVNKALARTSDMVEKRKKLGQQVAK
jgi:tetratricopeptide (TPR) repeat protein